MNDVFISYTHKDNAPLMPGHEGWVEVFERFLKRRLTQLLGRDAHVWRDANRIEGSSALTPTIAKEVRDANLLVSIVSPGYLQSSWCNTEITLFARAAAAAGGLLVGEKARIVKILKTPVDRNAEKELEGHVQVDVADLIGHEFYRVDERGIAREFDPNLAGKPAEEFYARADDVANDLKNLLAALGVAVAKPDAAAATGITVYVAETTSDVAADADRLRRELRQFGHRVLPEQPYERDGSYEACVRADLEASDVAIQLVGAVYGIVPEEATLSIAELQYAAALAIAEQRTGMRRLVWAAPGTQSANPRQIAFLTRLQDDERFLQCSFDALRTSVRDLVVPSVAPASAEPTTSPHSIYLVHDVADSAAIAPIQDWLIEQGHEVTLPLSAGDEREMREDHEATLTTCDAVLIYYGAATEFWLRAKLRDLQKAFGYGRARPFAARAVLLADPPRADKERFRSNEVIALDAHGAFAPETLTPFLNAIAKSRGAAI